MSNLIEVSSVSELREVLEQCSKVVVTFTQPRTCVPCRQFKPHLEKTAEQADDVAFAVVDLDKVPDAISEFDVMGVPTVKLFNDGVFSQNLQSRTVLPLLNEINS